MFSNVHGYKVISHFTDDDQGKILILHYIKNQQVATLAVLFISNCKITLHVSDAFCVHHQEC